MGTELLTYVLSQPEMGVIAYVVGFVMGLLVVVLLARAAAS